MANPEWDNYDPYRPNLADAFCEIALLTKQNATHIKRGIKLQDQSKEDVLKWMAEELIELAMHPFDIDEVADVAIFAMRYAVMLDCPQTELTKAIRRKLRERFRVDGEHVH